jgi:EAL domain-containing protein (putative c-di-GMP-specific phosphodiesterase class I)
MNTCGFVMGSRSGGATGGLAMAGWGAGPGLSTPRLPGENAAASERLLADAAERALHAPNGKLALALHMSRLRPPAPRPHHARIAMALLEDGASRHGGHVFSMRNGDLVMLCAAPGQAAQAPLLALQAALSSLFGADAPAGQRLTTIWRLADQGDAFKAYIAGRLAEPPPAGQGEAEDAYTEGAVQALDTLLSAGNVSDLLAQQTAVQIRGAAGLPLAGRLAPLFRELTFSHAALTQRHPTAAALADPFLFRHFAARLDARMLEHVQADLEAGGRLTRPAVRLNLPINLNMTLESIVSPAFARLLQMAQLHHLPVGVEVSLMEAGADPALMEYARMLLARAGFMLLLDGVDHIALAMTYPAGLQPDFVKLIWSPRLMDSPDNAVAAIDAAIRRLGPERIILQRAEGEDALAWGQAHGITRFQGYFIDAVQAAARIAVCHSARACSLRQCTVRAGTLNPGVRTGCGNPALLDMAPPMAHAVAQGAAHGHAAH